MIMTINEKTFQKRAERLLSQGLDWNQWTSRKHAKRSLSHYDYCALFYYSSIVNELDKKYPEIDQKMKYRHSVKNQSNFFVYELIDFITGDPYWVDVAQTDEEAADEDNREAYWPSRAFVIRRVADGLSHREASVTMTRRIKELKEKGYKIYNQRFRPLSLEDKAKTREAAEKRKIQKEQRRKLPQVKS